MTENSRYDDIINLDRPASKHVKMPRSDRAAQFSPFAALTDYHDKIAQAENAETYTRQEIIDFLDT